MKRLTRAFETQELTGYLDHLIIKTPESIEVTADKETNPDWYYEQHEVFVNIINIIRMRANVVMIGPNNGSTISVAVEAENAVKPIEVQKAIREMGDAVPFGDTTVDLTGVQVVRSDFDLVDKTQQHTLTIDFNDADGDITIGSVPADTRITDVTVDVVTAFDGTPTLNIGDADDNSRLVSNGDLDLTQVETYTFSPDHEYQTLTDIIAYWMLNGATQGQVDITVTYV